jgi:hypothetical protein
MMVLSKEPLRINFSCSRETELNVVWEGKQQDPLLWSKKDTELEKKNKLRSELIEKLRDPFLSKTKERRHH